MTKADLDALNERAREWRSRDKPVQDQRVTADVPTQLDLWDETIIKQKP
jgi:hypothetical protein